MTGQRETLSHAAHSLLERAGNGLAGTDASWGGHFINAAESIDVIDSGHSPVLSPKVDVKIDLEPAWFGGSSIGARVPPPDIAPHVRIKDIFNTGNPPVHFAWTKPDIERSTVVLSCRLSSETIYSKVYDRGE